MIARGLLKSVTPRELSGGEVTSGLLLSSITRSSLASYCWMNLLALDIIITASQLSNDLAHSSVGNQIATKSIVMITHDVQQAVQLGSRRFDGCKSHVKAKFTQSTSLEINALKNYYQYRWANYSRNDSADASINSPKFLLFGPLEFKNQVY